MYTAHDALNDLYNMYYDLLDPHNEKEAHQRLVSYLNQQKIRENIPEVCRSKNVLRRA